MDFEELTGKIGGMVYKTDFDNMTYQIFDPNNEGRYLLKVTESDDYTIIDNRGNGTVCFQDPKIEYNTNAVEDGKEHELIIRDGQSRYRTVWMEK